MNGHPYRHASPAAPKRPRFWWWSWPAAIGSIVGIVGFNLGSAAFGSCSQPSMPVRDRLEDEAKRHLTRTHPGARVNVACGVAQGDWGTCNGTLDGRSIEPMTCVVGEGCR